MAVLAAWMLTASAAMATAYGAAVLTLEEAAGLLRVPVSDLYQLADRGAVPARRIGVVWRFSRAALLAWLEGDPRQPAAASLVFWIMLSVLFVFLGINKQIDMQTWVTDVGRRIAMSQGWYEQRGRVQTLFVLLVAIGGLTTLTILLKLTRELLPRHVLAFFGLILLAYYMLVRASSFHDLDAAMRIEIMAVRVSWMIEMGGIICVGACAVMNSWWHKSLQPIDQPAGEPA